MALWRTPVVALMPDITPSRFRSQANGIINFMGGVGAIISFLVGSRLYRINVNYPFWMGSILVIAAALMVLIFIREPKNHEEKEKQPGMFASLGEVWRDQERSTLRILLAIFFWFLGYNAIEAFFTLYAVNQLGMNEADGALLLGQLSFVFVLFALPAGYIGGVAGCKPTIVTGIAILTMTTLMVFFLPQALLTQELTILPLLGAVPVLGALLMISGAAWALININSLPMVVDMTTAARLGTFTGLYYLFSTLSAIAGPIINGIAIQLTGENYNIVWILAPVFMAVALVLMLGVRRGEAVYPDEAPSAQLPVDFSPSD